MTQDGARPLAVVTGASAGLGAAFARALAVRNYDLVLVARRKDRLEALLAELSQQHGITGVCVGADLSLPEAHVPVVEALTAQGRDAAMLVNNAGYSLPQTFMGTDWNAQRDFIMTLVMAVCGLTHALLPGLIKNGGGKIIMLGSMAGLSPGGAGHTLYPAAKSFVNKFALSLDAELRGKGIKVTCVNPGVTDTEFQAANGTQDVMSKAPRMFRMSAEDVVAQTLRANDDG
ncbi:MAG: SDR family NAD(P)-dependent oxidoreductase, partial [Caulobacterales bacterium]